MKKTEIIFSSQNEKIKKILKVKNKKNKRDKFSLFLIEGIKEITQAIDSNIQIDSLFICSKFLKDKKILKVFEKKSFFINECDEKIFKKISYKENPDGVIALAKQFKYEKDHLDKILLKKNPFILVCESLEKPGNLGAILRTADAAGIDAIILANSKIDIFNPNVIRSSLGTIFNIPIFNMKTQDVISFLKSKKINIISTYLKAQKSFNKVDLNKPLAIVVGSEEKGITKAFIEESNYLIKIPMFGKADSLNVANATTIILYEVLRQRKII